MKLAAVQTFHSWESLPHSLDYSNFAVGTESSGPSSIQEMLAIATADSFGRMPSD